MCIENYVKVVEEMLARGEKVTLQEVRRIAGKGSYSTISDANHNFLADSSFIGADFSAPIFLVCGRRFGESAPVEY